MVVKDIKKQKPALFGSKQLIRNVVFCLNKATLSGTATSHAIYCNFQASAKFIYQNRCWKCKLFLRGLGEIEFASMMCVKLIPESF